MAKSKKDGRLVIFKLRYDVIEKLIAVSEQLGQSRTVVTERAIEEYYDKYCKDEE